MNRIRLIVLPLLLWFPAGFALAQTTTIAAPAGSLTMGGGTPISTGTVVFVPVDGNGKAVPVTLSTGGINVPAQTAPAPTTWSATPPSMQALGYTCTVVAGAITGTCTVPDEATAEPSGFRYNVTVTDTSTGNATSGYSTQINQVAGVTGASFRLDQYNPGAAIVQATSGTISSGSGIPTTICKEPAIFIRTDMPSLYVCSGTAFNLTSGSGGSVSSSTIATTIQTQTGCSTAGYVWVPASNTCVAASGGSVTSGSVATAIQTQTGCATAGYVWVPASNTCAAPGAVSLPGTVNQIPAADGSGAAVATPSTSNTAGDLASGRYLTAGAALLVTPTAASAAANCGNQCVYANVTWNNFVANHQNLFGSYLTTYGPSISTQNHWRAHAVFSAQGTYYDRGIGQGETITTNCPKTNDCAGEYLYTTWDGGARTTSDEGGELRSSNGGENGPGYVGKITSIDASKTLPVLSTATANNPWITDGTFLLRTQSAVATGNLNGYSVVDPGFANNLQYLPVTNTLPLTTAYCQSLNALPLSVTAANVATLQTISCVPGMIGGAIPAIAGPSATAATFTVGTFSGTTLTVGGTVTGTINVGDVVFGTNINVGTIITALGTGSGGAGTYTVNQTQTTTGTVTAAETVAAPLLADVFSSNLEQTPILAVGAAPAQSICTGSIAGTTLTLSSCTGTPAIGQYVEGVGVTYLTTITAGSGPTYTVSKSQTVASEAMGTTAAQSVTLAHRETESGNPYLFQGGIAGTFMSFDDNLTKTTMRSAYPVVGSLTGTDAIYWANVKEGLYDIPLPSVGAEAETPYSVYHLYAGAEIVANLDGNHLPQLEPNAVPWATNDTVEDPHYFAIDGHADHLYMGLSSPNVEAINTGQIISVTGYGAGGVIPLSKLLTNSIKTQYSAFGGWETRPIGQEIYGQVEKGWLMDYQPVNGGCLVCGGSIAQNGTQGTATASSDGYKLTVTGTLTGYLAYGQEVIGGGLPAGTTLGIAVTPSSSSPGLYGTGANSIGVYTLNFLNYSDGGKYPFTSQTVTLAAGPYYLLKGFAGVNLIEDPVSGNATLQSGATLNLNAGNVVAKASNFTINGAFTQTQAVVEPLTTYTTTQGHITQTMAETLLFNCGGNCSATLNSNGPTYLTGTIYRFKDIAAVATLTINGSGGSLIDGASSLVLTPNQAAAIQFDGTNWRIIAAPQTVVTGIANVVVALPTSAIAANTCTSGSTVTMTGLLTTSTFTTAFATDPSGVTGWGASGGLSFVPWPTANTLNYKVCNASPTSITPGALSLNVGAR